MLSLGVIIPVAAVLTAVPYAVHAPVIPPHFGTEVTVESLYKDNGKVVGSPQMNLTEAEEKCPRGSQTVRQNTREDGGKTYLSWVLRCR
jgi:hypothetical protein